jgi:hypothetical protein
MKRQGSENREEGTGAGRVLQFLPLRPGGKSFWSRFLGLTVILLAAAVAVAPLLMRGPSCGHDFDFHLVSWLDCLNSWRHGILYPHWTPSANFGAGEPRFIFYSPLTWMLGAALGFVLPWTLVPVTMTFLMLAGTGLATRALARQLLPEGAATLAGCAALFSGYALFTAYERSAFAEFAGGFWIPLVLLFILRDSYRSHPFRTEREKDGAPRVGSDPVASVWQRAFDGSAAPLALSVAGAWLANPTVGVMACYLLAAVALTRALLSRSWAAPLRASAGAALGMGLVAAYLLPAAWERRWVDISQVTEDPGQTLENNWLFAVHAEPSLALHDAVLRTASIIAVVMIAVALGGLLVCRLRGRLPGGRRWWIPLALIPFAVLFLQFPASHRLWNLLPELRFLQFPWRWLLVLEAPMAIFFASALWPGKAARPWRRVAVVAACIAVFVAMIAFAGREFFQSCDDEDAVPGMLSTYGSGQGFIGTGEYEPIGADNSLVATGLPAACLTSNPATVLGALPESQDGQGQDSQDADDAQPIWNSAQGSCEETLRWQSSQPEHRRLQALIPRAGFLILRLRAYPAWRITVNGQPLASLPRRDDGLIVVPVPQGPINLAVDWTTTPDVIAGRWLSALAALLLAGLWLLERKLSRPRLS